MKFLNDCCHCFTVLQMLRNVKITDNCEEAKRPNNKDKNRYRNVVPCEYTSAVMKPFAINPSRKSARIDFTKNFSKLAGTTVQISFVECWLCEKQVWFPQCLKMCCQYHHSDLYCDIILCLAVKLH